MRPPYHLPYSIVSPLLVHRPKTWIFDYDPCTRRKRRYRGEKKVVKHDAKISRTISVHNNRAVFAFDFNDLYKKRKKIRRQYAARGFIARFLPRIKTYVFYASFSQRP